MNRIIKPKCFILISFSSQLIGCALLPQTYDSPIPVYVDLGDAKPVTTTPPKSTPKHNTQPNH